jgi:heavy metal sensor kinase
MKQPKTLRVRFALWTAGLFLVILTAFGLYVYTSLARGLYTEKDNSLTLNASQFIAGLNIEDEQLIMSDSFQEEPENASLREQGYTFQILNPQGEVLQTFGFYHELLPTVSPTISSPFFSTIDSSTGAKIRVYTTPVIENGQLLAILQVAQSLEDIEATLQRLLLILIVSVPLLVLISGLSGYWLAARALQPIDQITGMARRISAEDLSARLNISDTNDEVGRLASTFDNMLSRLDESFRRERQFTSDASHELRTPLTVMKAIIDRMKKKSRTSKEYQQAFDELSEEVDRLGALTEDLLELARSDSKKEPAFQSIDLSSLMEDVSDSLRPLMEAKGLNFTRQIEDKLCIWGDSDDLIRLFVNLLDNAIKFTERGEISLTAASQNNGINIVIKDTGKGIDARYLPHIFDRFYRSDEARTTRGSGLGLAIANDIVQRHGGKIEVSSRINVGSVFTISFPK